MLMFLLTEGKFVHLKYNQIDLHIKIMTIHCITQYVTLFIPDSARHFVTVLGYLFFFLHLRVISIFASVS